MIAGFLRGKYDKYCTVGLLLRAGDERPTSSSIVSGGTPTSVAAPKPSPVPSPAATPQVNQMPANSLAALFPSPPTNTERASAPPSTFSGETPNNASPTQPRTAVKVVRSAPPANEDFSSLFDHKIQLGSVIPITMPVSDGKPVKPVKSAPIKTKSSAEKSKPKKVEKRASSPAQVKKAKGKEVTAASSPTKNSESRSKKQEKSEPADQNRNFVIGKPIKEGHLWIRKGNLKKTWKIFWFSLNDRALCYLENPQSIKPLRVFPLRSIQNLEEIKVKDSELNFVLKTTKKKYYLEAESAEARSAWISAIRRAVENAKNPTTQVQVASSPSNISEASHQEKQPISKAVISEAQIIMPELHEEIPIQITSIQSNDSFLTSSTSSVASSTDFSVPDRPDFAESDSEEEAGGSIGSEDADGHFEVVPDFADQNKEDRLIDIPPTPHF
eukprot:TRINITY_DN5034_c0_g1_i1.p1 TRINITY_DN5034_c0_g1~~TRINITY_DN5034_c0_g1_i1.p1  ORF type:complete len:442 (-),score=114.20 TRINITY_DN5034_c0_g1_i1:23-1348(-)